MNPILVVDGGDCFFKAPTKKAPTASVERQDMRSARLILNTYNFIGYNALAIGPIDLQLGLHNLQALQKEARFPFLCANLVHTETGKPIFEPYAIIEKGGVRFGVYGVIQKRLNATYAKRVLGNAAKIIDPIETTQRIVKELREKTDVVVALSHVYSQTNDEILKMRLGIDFLVDPLSRLGSKMIWVNENEYCREKEGSILLRIDGQGSRVGVADLYFTDQERRYAAYNHRQVPLDPHFTRHPEIIRLDQLLKRGKPYDLPANHDPTKFVLEEEYLGEQICKGCHEEQHKFWKSTKHASTYASLVETNAQHRMECVSCHSVGYGVAFLETTKIGNHKEAQCETCHGSKPKHADDPSRYRFGPIDDAKCWGCHNPEHTSKEFDLKAGLPRASCPPMKA